MRQVLLVRFGEVHLKGQNRPYFLKQLVQNVRHAVAPVQGHVWLNDSRIYVSDMTDMDECIRRVCRVFGIHSVSPAIELEKDYEAICNVCVDLMKERTGTFKVLARRSDKHFPIDSMTMAPEIGGRVLASNPKLSVDVHHPQHRLSVEIRDNAYVYVEEVDAVGGMPMGTGGKAALLLSGGIDSPVSGYQLMKRGVKLAGIHFESPPYTSARAREKVLELAKLLGEYGGGMKVYLVPFTEIQMEIHEKCPEGMTTLIMRRFMMRIAQNIAEHNDCKAIVTGENLGQVASQTMEAMASTQAVTDLPVLQPLIGMDKAEIIQIARRIGTFDTSILPYEDCCTVFTPRHPKTHPVVADVAQAESVLDIDALVQEAVDGIERIRIGYEC